MTYPQEAGKLGLGGPSPSGQIPQLEVGRLDLNSKEANFRLGVFSAKIRPKFRLKLDLKLDLNLGLTWSKNCLRTKMMMEIISLLLELTPILTEKGGENSESDI